MKTKFKTGDWVVHGFRLKQIKEVRNGRYSLSDGYFETSGPDDDHVRMATFQSKRLANDCESYYDKLHKDFDRTINNWPDLCRWFEDHCLKMIDALDNEERLKKLYDELRQMYDSIVEKCNGAQEQEVGGVRLFSRR